MKSNHGIKSILVRFFAIGMACALIGMIAGCEPSNPTNPTTPDGDYDTYGSGSYAATGSLSSGPSGDSGVFYPSGIESGSSQFPVFVFGCGGGSDPGDYEGHLQQMASWGFIVIAEVSTGDGTELTDAIDWIISENNRQQSKFYQNVDTSKIAAGGHSMGSISTFEIADDPRLSTTIHVAGGSFDGNGSDSLRNPTAYICGGDDTMATPNAETDYEKTTVPVFFTVMDGVSHIYAVQEGLPAMIAWLRWHLSGETFRKADFLDADGVFQTGIFDSKAKNWDESGDTGDDDDIPGGCEGYDGASGSIFN